MGLTSGEVRDSMGVGFRPFGNIPQARIFESGVRLNLADVDRIGIENELAFKFDADVPRHATRTDVIGTIAGVAPGFELNQQRRPRDSNISSRLADNLSNWGLVVGKLVPNWSSVDFSSIVVGLYENDELIQSISAKNHIDDHLESLLALADTLQQFDQHIRAGDWVITGSFTRKRLTHPGSYLGKFSESIGSVEVNWL